MFDFFARVLNFFYGLYPSYGLMIILLTLSVRIVFTPLTVRGTKSMLALRRIQPEMRALQKKYKNDRQQMNFELQGLYRKHKINPLGGCLPLLAQAPVFLVMYQVLRGLTRRTSDLGKSIGSTASQCTNAGPGVQSCDPQAPAALDSNIFESTFNPRYLDQASDLFRDLSNSVEMLWIGIDLSLTPSDALSISLVKALPYLFMIVMVGILGYVQQRQIAGRTGDAEINPIQKTMMRVLPIFLPLISFTLPAGLTVYFLTTSAVGIAQQDFITRRVYKPFNKEEDERKAKAEEEGVDEDEVDDEPRKPGANNDEPRGILGQLMQGPKQEDPNVHGRRPTTVKKRPKAVPPKAQQNKALPPKAQQAKALPPKAAGASKKGAGATKQNNSNGTQPSRQGRKSKDQSPAQSSNGTGNAQRESRRVTPSKREIEAQKQANKKKRR